MVEGSSRVSRRRGRVLAAVLLPLSWFSVCSFAIAQAHEAPPNVRKALFAMPVREAPTEGMRVRVEDAAGVPIASAHVFFVDPERARAHTPDRSRVPGADLERMMLENLLLTSDHFVAGEDGCIVVPAGVSYGMAVTANGLGMIQARSRDPDAPPPAVVRETGVYEVRASLASGRPAKGLAIALGTYGERGIDRFERTAVARTDERGEVRFRVPGLFVNSALRRQGHVVAQAFVIGDGPVRAVLAAGEPANIVLPPCGRVIVRLHDADERPRSDIEDALLLQPGESAERMWRRLPSTPEVRADRLSEDEATFDYVALGKPLVAHVRAAGVSGVVSHSQDGPTREGELVVFGVRAKAASPILAGRLLDENGDAVVQQEVAVLFVTDELRDRQVARTDEHGALRIAVPEAMRTMACRIHVVRRGDPKSGATNYAGSAVHELAAGAEGLVEIGDVTLQPEPVAVAGRLLDPDGAPVAGVDVTTVMTWLDEHSRPEHLRSLPAPLREALVHRATTDAEGRFVFCELMPRAVANGLSIADGTWLCDPGQRVVTGAGEVVLTAYEPASIELRFRTPPPSHIVFDVRRDGAVFQTVWLRDEDPAARRAPQVPPGTYDIVVTHRDEELARIEGVEVRSGQACADPRLRDIDWTSGWTVVRLRVRSDRGGRVHPGVRALGENVRWGWNSSSVDDDVLALRAEETKLLIHHERYRSVFIEELKPELDITLQPRLEVAIVLPDGLELPAGVAIVVIASDYPARLGQLSRVIWAGADTRLLVDGPGRHRVRVSAPAMGGRKLWQGDVVVEEGPAPSVRLAITADEIEAIRKALSAGR